MHAVTQSWRAPRCLCYQLYTSRSTFSPLWVFVRGRGMHLSVGLLHCTDGRSGSWTLYTAMAVILHYRHTRPSLHVSAIFHVYKKFLFFKSCLPLSSLRQGLLCSERGAPCPCAFFRMAQPSVTSLISCFLCFAWQGSNKWRCSFLWVWTLNTSQAQAQIMMACWPRGNLPCHTLTLTAWKNTEKKNGDFDTALLFIPFVQ